MESQPLAENHTLMTEINEYLERRGYARPDQILFTEISADFEGNAEDRLGFPHGVMFHRSGKRDITISEDTYEVDEPEFSGFLTLKDVTIEKAESPTTHVWLLWHESPRTMEWFTSRSVEEQLWIMKQAMGFDSDEDQEDDEEEDQEEDQEDSEDDEDLEN